MSSKGPPILKNIKFFRDIKESQWKIPILGSLLVHIVILGGSILSPALFSEKDIMEIQTVDLVSVEESKPEKTGKPAVEKEVEKGQPSPSEPEPAPEPEPGPESEKIVSEVAEKIREMENQEAISEELVSLKPRNAKKEFKSPEKTRGNEDKIDNALNKIKREIQRKKAEEKARQAEQEARAYAREAVKDLSDLLKSQDVENGEESTGTKKEADTVSTGQDSAEQTVGEDSGKTGGTPSKSILKKYLASIFRKIQTNWILPEVTDWQEDLEAVLAITITREGRVISSKFEKRSSNIYFDRFVEKTVEKSSPLPPFPDTLKKEQIEIGLIFHPQGLK